MDRQILYLCVVTAFGPFDGKSYILFAMELSAFISDYREAFGEHAPLPLLFYYADVPVAQTEKINGCFFKALHAVRRGDPVALSAENVGCGGGKFYTGFSAMPAHVPGFVSLKERYKQTPEMVLEYIAGLELQPAPRKFLNFVRIDRAKGVQEAEGVLFFATPDVLSGLCAWAFFDNNDADAVTAPFGSGCSSMISAAVGENRRRGRRTFIGLFDPSVRPHVGAAELGFAIPFHRFREMCRTMRSSCLFEAPAWKKLQERIAAG